MMLFAASVVHWVGFFGSQSSAVLAASAVLMSTNPPPVVPPVMSTVPSGRMVELRCRRGRAIDPALVHDGVAALRSIFSAVAVGAPVLASGDCHPGFPPPPT